jgi:hypothetical protein
MNLGFVVPATFELVEFAIVASLDLLVIIVDLASRIVKSQTPTFDGSLEQVS